MHSIRRAATRSTLTSSVFSAAAVGAKSQTISSSLRALSAPAISSRYFSVAAPKAFSRSAAFRDEQQQSQPQAEFQKHVLFVQNYSFDVKPDDLKEAFSKFGEVIGVSMPPGKTFCFVYYRDAESVTTAAENVDGTYWYGRRIVAKPREARVPAEPQRRGERQSLPPRVSRVHDSSPSSTLYVGNIAFQSSDTDLNNLFANLDGVKDVRVAVDRVTGWPRGFAHADFVSVEAATAALEALKGTKILDRELKVTFAPQSSKEMDRRNRMSEKSSSRGHNSQAEVEQRVEAEHEQAEEAQKEQKPEAGKQDMNWNA